LSHYSLRLAGLTHAGRIELVLHHTDTLRSGDHLDEELDLLCDEVLPNTGEPRHVVARSGQTSDQSRTDRIASAYNDNGDCRGRALRRQGCSGAPDGDNVDPTGRHVGSRLRVLFGRPSQRADVEREVLALDIAALSQTFAECLDSVGWRQAGHEQPDLVWLLGTPCEGD